MKQKKIDKQNAKSRFAGISLSLAVMGMLGLLLAFSDRNQPVVWVAFILGILGVIGINVVYSAVIAKLSKAGKVKKKLKREKAENPEKNRKKKAGKGDNFKGAGGKSDLKNPDTIN